MCNPVPLAGWKRFIKQCLCILYYHIFPRLKAYKEGLCQYPGYLNLKFSHFQVNTKFLAPLFLAYDDRLKEKEQLIRTYDVSFVAIKFFIQLLHFFYLIFHRFTSVGSGNNSRLRFCRFFVVLKNILPFKIHVCARRFVPDWAVC